jgi:hypothetical protein
VLQDVLGLSPLPCETERNGIDVEGGTVRVWRCAGYSACLDLACRLNWKGFTCRACPVYSRYWDVVLVRIVRKVAR